MLSFLKINRALLVAVVVAATALLPGPAAAAAGTVTELAHGFDNPRGVAFLHGRLLVGEAGHGGTNACFVPVGGPGTICVGFTSRISTVEAGRHRPTPLVTGLFSISLGAEGVLGVGGLSVQDDGGILAILGANPQALAGFTCATAACQQTINKAMHQAGHLISAKTNGDWRSLASVGAFDYEYTKTLPPPTEIDANPYGVLAFEHGALVADAGANTLDWVGNGGAVSVVTHFQRFDPNTFPTDAVPTCVVRAGGALWVADLSGRLFRMTGSTATQVAVPFITHVTNCTTDGQGHIFLINMWDTATQPSFPSPFTGSVVKFNTASGTASVLASHLNFPNMGAVGPDGNLYVSANSVCPATGVPGLCPQGGTVLRIRLS